MSQRHRRRSSSGGGAERHLLALLAVGLCSRLLLPSGFSFCNPAPRRASAASSAAALAARAEQQHRAGRVVRWAASQPSSSEHKEEEGAEQPSAEEVLEGASEEGRAASEEAYELWRDQFPLAAARRDYYGLLCDPPSVRARFLCLAELVGISPSEALETFRRDTWVLSEPTEKIPEKLEALRSVAESEDEVLDFLRAAPRAIATTTAVEIRQRGLANMRARATVGDIYEMIIAPARFVIKQLAASSARELESKLEAQEQGGSAAAVLKDTQEDQRSLFQVLTILFFGGITAVLVWASYMDATYGGPVHGKGFCFPAGVVPSYVIPDAEGNARLPCSCAPLYKWYLEPLMSSEKKQSMQGMAPKVESKNCGRTIGGEKKECDPTTIGGCVWTAEDLEKDPSTWDRRELTYWERQRLAKTP